MDLIKDIRIKAAGKKKTIVLPESGDERILSAAERIINEGIAAGVILIGDPNKIKIKKSAGIKIINHFDYERKHEFIETYSELRKGKETPQQTKQAMADPLFFGAMLVRKGLADCMVCGSVNSTANVLRSSIKVIGTREGCSLVSSFFIIQLKDEKLGEKGGYIFADCGVVPNPDARQLAQIAIASADSARTLFGWEPRVAMLSYSTKGSSGGESVGKVREAVEIVKAKEKGLCIDGEIQLDAAVVPDVARKKNAYEVLEGRANILIFPDLNSGNISYKLAQRFAGAQATGPILQGLAKPVNDLSRGCSVEDIVNSAAITMVQ